MKKSIVAFCPADNNNLIHFQKLENSLRKFHSKEELPLLRFDNPGNDPLFFYRATPIIASQLIQEYDTVIKLDADQIITGSLADIWQENFDVATVLNDPTYPIFVWDILPYYNNGLIVLKSKKFIYHWYNLCFSNHFNNYQFREQDILNILCSDYFDYNVRCLDVTDKYYGEFVKHLWATAKLVDNKIIIKGKELCVIHFGGGNDPSKGNYQIRFQKDVVERIEWLIKE